MNEVECQVRKVKEAETGGSEFHDIYKSGRSCIALMPYIIHWVDELMW